MGGWETTFSFLGRLKRPIFNGEPFSFHCPGRYAAISYTPLKIDMSQKKDHFKTIFHLPTINVQGLCWFLGGVSLVIGFIQLYSPLPWFFGQKSRKMQGFSSCNLIYLQCFSGDPRIKTWWDLVFLYVSMDYFYPKVTILSNKSFRSPILENFTSSFPHIIRVKDSLYPLSTPNPKRFHLETPHMMMKANCSAF